MIAKELREKCDEIKHIIEEDHERIAKLVNVRFEETREIIKEKLLSSIKEMITPVPKHYVWRYDGCPYDYSGHLKEQGYVSLDQTISQFLENEYTGYSRATYVSHCGLYWCNWGDDLSDKTGDIGYEIMQQVIIEYLTEKLGREVSDEEISDANWDPVYDLCYASDFFFYEAAVEFVGIGNISLSLLIEPSQTGN